MIRNIVVAGLLLACCAPAISAERPVVVELFTSEGCSSCPPADAFLTELAHGRRNVLPLAFHVTYWNSLGWRDPFSLEAATSRQSTYGARFGDGSYTPEMVVDGTKSLVGSERGTAEAAISAAKSRARTAAAITLSRNGSRVDIALGEGSGSGRILLVGFDPEHRTAVGRGGEQRPDAHRVQHRPLDQGRRTVERRGDDARGERSCRPGGGGAARGAGRCHRRRGATGSVLSRPCPSTSEQDDRHDPIASHPNFHTRAGGRAGRRFRSDVVGRGSLHGLGWGTGTQP